MNTTDTITLLLEQLLHDAHPLMVEALHMASVPNWYDVGLLQAIRQRDDLAKNEQLAQRMTRYSFITPLSPVENSRVMYTMRSEERAFLQRHWIAQDPIAYRQAQQQAFNYWANNPDPNPFAQAQNLLYHQLFVDQQEAANEIVRLFRMYRNDRQLAAIERLLHTAVSARFYLLALGDDLNDLDDLLAHLNALLAQLRGQWENSKEALAALHQKETLSPRLRPYVTRAYGQALANTGQFVEAIAQYEIAITLFGQQENIDDHSNDLAAEKAHTLIALGDAYVGLAVVSRGFDEKTAVSGGLHQWLTNLLYFFLSLPLVLYLSTQLGHHVWHPQFWSALRDLDWLIARLYAKGARYYRAADIILEAHGTPAEGVAADERLANLYLEIGDIAQAQETFTQLLQQDEAPLGDYRQAAVRVGLAEALLRGNQAAAAQEQLQTAVPILTKYEDPALLATARALLGMANQAYSPADALPHLQQALYAFQDQNKIGAATNISERLYLLAADTRLEAAQQETAVATANALPLRRYRTRYRHPLTILFQRGMIVLLGATIFLIAVSIVRLETGSAVAPQIVFNATPLLQSDNPDYTPYLSQGVSALRLIPSPNPKIYISLGLGIFVAYLLLSTGLGLFIILRTPLYQVQAVGDAETVQLDHEGITLGIDSSSQPIPWSQVSHYTQADIYVMREMLKDNAIAVVQTPGQLPILINGGTAWYPSVCQQITGKLPARARRTNLSFHLLNSRMGMLYALTLGVLGAFALLGQVSPALVTQTVFGTPYSLASLYPYSYLGLFIPSFWWFVIRPLHISLYLQSANKLPLLAMTTGVLLVVLRLVTLFRPWLTVPDIYPTLAALIFVGGAGVVIWRKRRAQDDTAAYPLYIRLGVAVLVICTVLIMGSHLWRTVSAYHYLILGNAQRDRALNLPDTIIQNTQVKIAVQTYTRAMAIAETPILGIRSSDGLHIPLGIPRPIQTIWLAALNSRAAMESQLGQYAAAVYDYTTVLEHTNEPTVYVSRAIAYQGLGTETKRPVGEIDIERSDYQLAINDFNQAIAVTTDQARYLLWRGVAYHALSRMDLADVDYTAALMMTGPGMLTRTEQAQAYTGRGWIAYSKQDYETAVDFFKSASAAVSEIVPQSSVSQKAELSAATEALLGLGYAHYSLREYDEALDAWNIAAEYNAQLVQPDPSVYISLGTLYWRVGTLGDDYEASGSNQCANSSLSTTQKEAKADLLTQAIANLDQAATIPQQTDAEVAFTYRTMGQVYFLLASCPEYDEAETLLNAVDSYSQAIALDPNNALYWHMRGRLAYSAWQVLPADAGIAARELLLQALTDEEKALALDPVEKGDYRPQVWYGRIYDPAVNGTLARAAELEASGSVEQADAYYDLVRHYATDAPLLLYRDALAAAMTDDWQTAVSLYHEGTLKAAAKEDIGSVRTAAAALRDYLLTKPRINVLTAYWPLLGDKRTWETAVSQLNRPDLYWRYRAEFGFRFSINLFKQRPGDEKSYETIYDQIIADIERAYALNPDAHQTWRDFFVDANIGWLYLRRGDDYYAAAEYDLALADYSEAAARIQPNSSNARSDLADTLFRAGITALQLRNNRSANKWYNEGIALAQRYDLGNKIRDAATALETLLENRPELAPTGSVILENLNNAQ